MAAPQLRFKGQSIGSATGLIERIGEAPLRSPFRSTVPLLALAKDDWPTFVGIVLSCGVSGDFSVSFEHEVHSASEVEGNPSCTDAMVISGDQALAIEAKWTEPRYPTVAARIRAARTVTGEEARAAAEGRNKAFIGGWLEHLRPYAAGAVTIEAFSVCVYQVVHRAASACGAGARPALAYLHFLAPHGQVSAASSDDYLKDLTKVHSLLGHPAAFPFFVVDLPMRPTAAFRAIVHLKKGEPSTGAAVADALLRERLFEFGKPIVRRVGDLFPPPE